MSVQWSRERALGIADQGASSVSNLAASISVAHVASRPEFGAFGVAFAVYLAALTIGRASIGDVCALKISSLKPTPAHQALRAAMAASLLVGVVLGAPILAVGLAYGGSVGHMLLIVGVFLPSLLLQDMLRYAGFSLHRPALALANDVGWLGTQLALLLALSLGEPKSPELVFCAWAATSFAGAMVASWRLRIAPAWFEVLGWFRNHGALIKSLVTEQAFISGVAQGAPLIVGAIAGLTAVGSMRATQTAFGPLTAFNAGLSLAIVPIAASNWLKGTHHFYRPLRLNGAMAACLTLGWTLVLVLVPMSWGEFILSENWQGVRELAVVTGLWLAVGFVGAPAISALRIVGRQWWSAIARIAFTPVMLASVLVGSLQSGAKGATIGLVASTAVSTIVLWWLFARSLRSGCNVTETSRAEAWT